jgi:ankyrin repeat protein
MTGPLPRPAAAAALLCVLCAVAPQAAAEVRSVADAAQQRDGAAVRALLKAGGDVNAAQGDGMTALHWAAQHDDVELATTLFYAGANLRATTRLGGYTPLLLASKLGHARMVDALLAAGASPNAKTTNGTTPLMLAAASGNLSAVKALLDRGSDLDARENAMGQTALMFAAAHGRAEVVRLLAARGGDVRATTKVKDLFPLTREAEEAFRAQVAGGPTQNQEGQAAAAAGAAATSPAAAAPAEAKAAAPAEPKAPASTPPASRPTSAAPAPKPARAAGAKPTASTAAPSSATPAQPSASAAAQPSPSPSAQPKKPQVPGVDRAYFYNELVGTTGGLTPLMLAARQGHAAAVAALLEAGADVNQVSAGDKTSPLLVAIINGQFDLARELLSKGADPKLAADNGVTPLYAVVNVQWAPKALYPQPRAHQQQQTTHLELMKALLERGADPNARLKKKVWYSGYNFDLSGVDETGATPFWRAAYASDVDAMRLLIAHGADPNTRTMRAAGRVRTGDGQRESKDVSGLPPVPVGGPAVTPLQAAAGVGYGEGFAANSHRHAPGGMLKAVKYLVEELNADVNATDHEGNTALHHAAARGDDEMILYLVSKGADPKAVNREGKTTVDMANGPVQRIEPFPKTIALLESLGAKNNHRCVSCDAPKPKPAEAR